MQCGGLARGGCQLFDTGRVGKVNLLTSLVGNFGPDSLYDDLTVVVVR